MRVGQARLTGCLVITSTEGVARLFVESGAVVSAFGDAGDGQTALEAALSLPNASHLWIPDTKPKKKTMEVNIAAYALKHSVARDVHFAETGKVQLSVGANQHSPTHRPATEHMPSDLGSHKKLDSKTLRTHYLMAEDRPGEKLMISKATVIIGREESCDIILNHIQVSRRHCIVQIQPRGLSFRDLGSTNGITVNGFPADDGFLGAGDILRLGSYALTVGRES